MAFNLWRDGASLFSHAGSHLRSRTRVRLSLPRWSPCVTPHGAGFKRQKHPTAKPLKPFLQYSWPARGDPSSPAARLNWSANSPLLAGMPDPVIFPGAGTLCIRSVQQPVAGMTATACFGHLLYPGAKARILPDQLGAAFDRKPGCAVILADEGVDAEVIDVATLNSGCRDPGGHREQNPGACVIVHEAHAAFGCGCRRSLALVARARWTALPGKPVARVTRFDCVIPLCRQEMAYLPRMCKSNLPCGHGPQ